MNIKTTIFLSFILFLSACSGTKLTTGQVVSGIENAVGQTAAAEMAKQTLNNMAAKVGLTPQQSQQILPMLTQYYTSTATALKSNTGTQGVLKGFKDTFLSQVKGVLTPAQFTQVKQIMG